MVLLCVLPPRHFNGWHTERNTCIKSVAFAQGLTVLVPKQQLLVSEFLKLTVGNTMQARQRVKKKV